MWAPIYAFTAGKGDLEGFGATRCVLHLPAHTCADYQVQMMDDLLVQRLTHPAFTFHLSMRQIPTFVAERMLKQLAYFENAFWKTPRCQSASGVCILLKKNPFIHLLVICVAGPPQQHQ
jgi:hypothetical protein